MSQGDRVTHKFAVGQVVDLAHMVSRPAAPGGYEIRSLVPASDNDMETPRYRIKNIAEQYERVAPENELTLSNRPMSVFS
jgi:hypothetical protein